MADKLIEARELIAEFESIQQWMVDVWVSDACRLTHSKKLDQMRGALKRFTALMQSVAALDAAHRSQQESASADAKGVEAESARFTLERHGSGWAIYTGRGNFHHGMNWGQLSECDEALAKRIEFALNAPPAEARTPLTHGWQVGEKTPEVLKILGTMCFECIGFAKVLRLGGEDIPTRAESEQAHTLHYLLSFYASHGDEWRPAAIDDIKRREAEHRAALSASGKKGGA